MRRCVTTSKVCSSAIAADGASSDHCPQCGRKLALPWIRKPNGCFSELLSAGPDPKEAFELIQSRRCSGYSITLSARSRSSPVRLMPSAFAVLRLITR